MSWAFPDINVWLALTIEHTQQRSALDWWRQQASGIAFCRFTQLGLLRLLTTSGVMGGQPLTMRQAWKAYDRFLNDERVEFVAEPPSIDAAFRGFSSGRHASPKLWADAYLLAFAAELGGVVITFDRALGSRSPSLLLQ
ncbi:MAG: PIN domain-containing protein [Acidobacteriia bacterium]|nr:PIN domain-containing protein [Terriglobia bacterium]